MCIFSFQCFLFNHIPHWILFLLRNTSIFLENIIHMCSHLSYIWDNDYYIADLFNLKREIILKNFYGISPFSTVYWGCRNFTSELIFFYFAGYFLTIFLLFHFSILHSTVGRDWWSWWKLCPYPYIPSMQSYGAEPE